MVDPAWREQSIRICWSAGIQPGSCRGFRRGSTAKCTAGSTQRSEHTFGSPNQKTERDAAVAGLPGRWQESKVMKTFMGPQFLCLWLVPYARLRSDSPRAEMQGMGSTRGRSGHKDSPITRWERSIRGIMIMEHSYQTARGPVGAIPSTMFISGRIASRMGLADRRHRLLFVASPVSDKKEQIAATLIAQCGTAGSATRSKSTAHRRPTTHLLTNTTKWSKDR